MNDVPVGEVVNVKLNGFVTDANGTKDSRVPSSREASRNAHDHHPGYAVVNNSQI